MAQHPFQLKKPKMTKKKWEWPDQIPTEVVFDPFSTVSATYGVALQTQFRGGQNVWSSRPAFFVIDKTGVIRHVDGQPDEDIREEGIFPVLDRQEGKK
jgi:peroxiredoxin